MVLCPQRNINVTESCLTSLGVAFPVKTENMRQLRAIFLVFNLGAWIDIRCEYWNGAEWLEVTLIHMSSA